MRVVFFLTFLLFFSLMGRSLIILSSWGWFAFQFCPQISVRHCPQDFSWMTKKRWWLYDTVFWCGGKHPSWYVFFILFLRDFDSLDEQNVEKNNQLAFDIAEKELGISPIMTGKEMASVGEPDKLSMVMYLTQFYEMFKDSLPSSGKGCGCWCFFLSNCVLHQYPQKQVVLTLFLLVSYQGKSLELCPIIFPFSIVVFSNTHCFSNLSHYL